MLNNKRIPYRVVTYNFVGPNPYNNPAANYVNLPACKGISSVDDVRMWSPGLIVECTAVLGQRITYKVKGGSGGHAHDMLFKNGKGTKAALASANEFGNGTADYTITGAGADGGVVKAAASATLAQDQAVELANATNLGGIFIYIMAVAY